MTIKVTVQPPQLIQGQETELVITLHNKNPGACTNIVVGFQLPLQIVLVKGSRRLRIPRLDGGASWQHRLWFLPKEVGHFVLRSTNFSFRDSRGLARRVPSLEVPLEIIPPSPETPPPEPQLRLLIQEAELPLEEGFPVQVQLTNEGDATAYQTTISARGRLLECEPVRVAELPPGEVAHVELVVWAKKAGRVPVRVEAICRGPGRKVIKAQAQGFLQVIKPPERAEPAGIQISVSGSTIGEIVQRKTETHMGDVVSIQRGGTSPTPQAPKAPRFCANCSHELTDLEGAKFCPHCGHRLAP
ncbi:MAG: zinc ribbon domain-containing protein [Anaerolineae bacterium]|nr:zinc ribbon domain-containing protein [Anaerolineae bacterium]